MTDNDIVKALELCRENERHSTCEHCLKCPFSLCDLTDDEDNCLDALYRRTINLINRQKAEIERLQAEKVTVLRRTIESAKANARAEAIKNFADMLKCEMQNLSWCNYRGDHYFLVDESFVDNVLEKFTENGDFCSRGERKEEIT